MADVTFEVDHVFRHAVALAQRSAVIRPVGGVKDMTKDGAVEAAVHRVVEVWRRRCNVLREAGLPVFQSVRFQYARNCPPTGVKCRSVGMHTHPCQLATLCPWCWGRHTVEATWNKVYAGMTGLGTLGTGEDPYKLVLVTRTDRYPDGPHMPLGLFDRVAGTMRRTARALKTKGAVGSLMLSVVQPGSKPEWWVYGTRVLALVPQDYAVPEGADVAPPTRRGVAVLVSKFARYPMGLMIGDPKMVVRVAALRGVQRLFRSAGVFRGVRPGSEPGETPRFLDL